MSTSALSDVSTVVVVTHGLGDKTIVWPVAPETTVVLQRFATTDSSSRNTLDQDEFLGGRIIELKTQVKHQKAANDKVKANLILHDVIQGHKALVLYPSSSSPMSRSY